MAGRGRGGRGRGGRPPGRPRRASSSSVESVHAAHVKYVKESSILKSLSPSLHSDDWPCFVLNDAVVYQKDWRTLGNLLKVDQQGPLYVRGRLEIDPVDHRGLVRNSHSKPVHIELSPTHSYSIGYEPICIWASGGAGWFEINPAPEYQAMYDDMSEAITLYYEVMKGYEAAKKARRGKKNKAAGPVTLDEVLLKSPIEFLLEFCDEVEKDFGHGMAKIKPATIHSKLFYKCSIKDYKAAPEITRFYSRALLKSLPDRWHVSPFYAWLQEVVDKPFQPHILSLEEIPLRCVRRNTMRKPSSSALFKPGRSSDGPHSDSSSKKGGKHLQPPLVGRRSGKAAGLRLAVKRSLDSDQDTDDRVTKAAKTSDSSDYDEDGSSEESDDEVTVKKEGGSGDAEAVRIVVRAEKIPSMSPSGPNGTWTCEEPECGYVVRAANEKAGQDLISAHFKYHEDRVAKISLAMDEGTRGHLPISNLLEKIRALGEKSKKDDEVVLNGTVLPDPIKRRLLV
ncbi:hypothetical protein UCRPA7_5840 [Phaeoacremonium minimum UCRPA7]|uniref:DNA (cytosine-5)-methyltransferase 1 replication foci domain-containing protein n=1 Tax=Phaeoacremonium minimum (strain UCR-PA7) TaxID=1286976 RepID=R8BH33_PHAM7|nr:hypothetical protein UCRPA7_5840 [Phaeoacremonium minimum UCRPA7]EON98621.1 hypothetical protein UCRPA7_5840 [Phaeoacremonium minimum UCRPA7]